MDKLAYIEVGSHCLCKCAPCNAESKAVPMSYLKLHRLLESLKELGFTEIRWTGREPLTNLNLSTLMDLHRSFKYTTLSTLLTPVHTLRVLLQSDRRMVSLTTVDENYKLYHKGGSWVTFLANYTVLSDLTDGDLEIYSTITQDIVKSPGLLLETADFLAQQCPPRLWSLFPAYDKSSVKVTQEFSDYLLEIIKKRYNYPVRVFASQQHENPGICRAPSHAIYITNSGIVYPCCMAGGEVGSSALAQVLSVGSLEEDGSLLNVSSAIPVHDVQLCNKCTDKYVKYSK